MSAGLVVRPVLCPSCGEPVDLVPAARGRYRLLDPGVRRKTRTAQHIEGAHRCTWRIERGQPVRQWRQRWPS
jgi:hypothetical protein